MELIGKTTINPLLFYTGKISGYIVWMVFFYALCNLDFNVKDNLQYNIIVAFFTLFLGLFFTTISLINLGKSTRLGLPVEDTVLKTNGIYKISRNPMYLGFAFFTVTSVIYTLNVIVLIMGLYSLIVYHLIILNEEKFLTNRFGADYENYKIRTRRYL